MKNDRIDSDRREVQPTDKDQYRTFTSLLEAVLQPAFRMALNLSQNRDDAEDLVQEASILAFRGFHTFVPGTNFRAWFFRILSNLSIQKYHKRKREPQKTDIEDLPELYLYHQTKEHRIGNGSSDPAGALMQRIETEQISQAIDGLGEEYRTVASLYFVEELSYQDVADILSIPIGTVRSRLHRARRMLQQKLWQILQAE